MKDKAIEQEAVTEEEGMTMETAEQPETAEQMHPLHAKMSEHYPDRKFNSDKEVMDAALEKLSDYQLDQETVIGALGKAGELAGIITDIFDDVPPEVAVYKNIPALLDLRPGDEYFDDIEKLKQDRIAARSEHEAFQAELSTNIAASSEVIRNFAESEGDTEEEIRDYLATVENIIADVIKGKLTPELLGMIKTAKNHKKELAMAVENATIEAKNENISATLDSDPKANTDGMPDLSNAAAPVQPEVMKAPTVGGKFLKGTGL